MFENLGNAISKKPNPTSKVIAFGPWPGGLVTENQPEQMKNSELFDAQNVVMVGSGVLRTRDGSTLVCSGCTGEVIQCDDIKVGATWYTIVSDSYNTIYKNVSGVATAIATMEGEPRFVGFMGLLLIFDGSYIKTWDGTDLTMAYDNGLGTVSPYQFNNRYDTETMFAPLGNGTVARVDRVFTSQAWDTGYTMPPTHVYVKMRKVGTPTGTVTVKLRLASDDSILASSDITTTIADFVTGDDGLEYEAIFSASDISTEMAPETEYILSLEYSGGTSVNYVDVLAVDTDTPVMSLKPGKPPKSVYGLVFKDRLFCIEGIDGANPSYLWYSNAGDHLDWSSSDGGGYAPVIDRSATNYPIGGIAEWNQGLWVFGTPRQPFLGQLSGASPSAYAIYSTMQKVSGHYRSIVVTPDDIVFAHPAGVDMVSSVQESSDIAAKSQAEKIRKTIQEHFSTAAVAGYDPEWGLYCLKMVGDNSVYIVHTRHKTVKYSGQKTDGYSPVTKWVFSWSGAPTAFGHGNGFMLIGTGDGKIYKMDKDQVRDAGTAVKYSIKTSYETTNFSELQAYKLNVNTFGRFGGKFDFKFYKNAARTSFFDYEMILPIDSTVLTSDLITVDTVDADFYALGESFFDRADINFNFRTLMVGIENITLYGKPLYFGPINILSRSVGGF